MKRVMNYDTSEELDGKPSRELIEESEADVSGTGAVPAYRDEAGVWQYVPPSFVDFYEKHHGIQTITVYVE